MDDTIPYYDASQYMAYKSAIHTYEFKILNTVRLIAEGVKWIRGNYFSVFLKRYDIINRLIT